MVPHSLEKDPCKELALHREERQGSVVVAVRALTLSFPERLHRAPSPVSRDLADAPSRANDCKQPR